MNQKLELKITGDISEISQGLDFVKDNLNIEITQSGKTVLVRKSEKETIVWEKSGEYGIDYAEKADFFRSLAILCDCIRCGDKGFALREKRKFSQTGIMLDVSDNAIPTVETVKKYLASVALMGINMFMLYTEDVYEMEKYPMFGYMRGAYTKEELKSVDDFADSLGIELIPCIQTLAHLDLALRWPYAAGFKENTYTLLPDCDETYEFIEEMFKTSRECFRTNKINVGMDEAGGLGLGKHLQKHGYEKSYDIMIRHINKVVEIAEKYDYEPMMWSDMFFKLGNLGGDYDLTSKIPSSTSDELPENIKMIYWDYCIEESATTKAAIKKHEDLGRETYFAGGIWTWNRITMNYDKSLGSATKQLKACKETGVDKVLVTIWGGHRTNYINFNETLPAIQIWAENTFSDSPDEKHIKKMFKICTGYNLDDWKALYVDSFSDEEMKKYKDPVNWCINASFQHFFQDIMTGLMDKTLSGFDFKSHFKKYLEKAKEVKNLGDMQWMFDKSVVLYEYLMKKCDIGVRIYNAYNENNKEELSHILETLGELKDLLDKYEEILYSMWVREYKIFGWNVHSAYFGKVRASITNAIRRISGYLSGEIDRLEELEVEKVYYNDCEYPLTEISAPDSMMSVS